MSSIFEKFFAQGALDKIAYYLGARDHSEKELIEKLRKKDFTEPEIKAALLKAKHHNWIADPEELSIKTTKALYRRRKGHYYIQRFLKKKGLPPTKRLPEEEVDNAMSLVTNNRKFKNLEPYELRKKVFLFLSNRGYDRSTINIVIESLK